MIIPVRFNENYRLTPIKNQSFINHTNSVLATLKYDTVCFKGENAASEFNQSYLLKRGILAQDEDITEFFDRFCKENFDKKQQTEIFELLKTKQIAFSTNVYSNPKNPKSAVRVDLNPNQKPAAHLINLISLILSGFGTGFNLSAFEDPIKECDILNGFYNHLSKKSTRPPAGIALLNINHPKIADFIKLKDNKGFENQCFDTSVVIDDEFLNCAKNNSAYILSDGSKVNAQELYYELLTSMFKRGEPGIIFSNDKNYVSDPCGAAKLNKNEGLTIGHLNLSEFYDPKTKVDYKKLSSAAKSLTKALKTLDNGAFLGVLGYWDLLNKLGLKYGSDEAKTVLEECFKVISKEDIKQAITPTGTTSRVLNTTAALEPKNNNDPFSYIDTLSIAQKYINTKGEGQISNTIIVSNTINIDELQRIVEYAKEKGLKGITIFRQGLVK